MLASLDEVRSALDDRCLPLEVLPGADVRIDDQLANLVKTGEALTIGDARSYLLLELPHDFFVDPASVFTALGESGVTAVLTHPERYRYLGGAIEPVDAWAGQGAVIQVTAGSLLGDFGQAAFAYAWRLAHAGLVDVIATDAHDTVRRRPRMRDAIQRLRFEVGDTETERLCRVNPKRILDGDPVVRHGEATR